MVLSRGEKLSGEGVFPTGFQGLRRPHGGTRATFAARRRHKSRCSNINKSSPSNKNKPSLILILTFSRAHMHLQRCIRLIAYIEHTFDSSLSIIVIIRHLSSSLLSIQFARTRVTHRIAVVKSICAAHCAFPAPTQTRPNATQVAPARHVREYGTTSTQGVATMDIITALFLAILGPCQFEDSTNCVWIASDSGNDIGTSFIDIEGTAYYIETVDSNER